MVPNHWSQRRHWPRTRQAPRGQRGGLGPPPVRTDRLQQIATELKSTHNVQIEVCSADLTKPEAPQQIYDFTTAKNLEIEFLINNAGFGAFGFMLTPNSRRKNVGNGPGELLASCISRASTFRRWLPAVTVT